MVAGSSVLQLDATQLLPGPLAKTLRRVSSLILSASSSAGFSSSGRGLG